jgi:hypothetical protein
LGVALGALVFVELLERGHDGLSYSVTDNAPVGTSAAEMEGRMTSA